MKSSASSRIARAAWVLSLVSTAIAAHDDPASSATTQYQHQAKGEFAVKLEPQNEDKAPGATLGRRTIDKRFSGDLEADSKGEMLTVLSDVKGSAAYVAVERVTGTLGGRKGSFALIHHGTMARGAQQASITVAPDSGAGELTGLTGRMEIIIKDGKHSYVFDYSLPQT